MHAFRPISLAIDLRGSWSTLGVSHVLAVYVIPGSKSTARELLSNEVVATSSTKSP